MGRVSLLYERDRGVILSIVWILSSPAQTLLFAATVFTVVFCFQAALWIVSVASPSYYASQLAIFETSYLIAVHWH